MEFENKNLHAQLQSQVAQHAELHAQQGVLENENNILKHQNVMYHNQHYNSATVIGQLQQERDYWQAQVSKKVRHVTTK